MIIEEGRIDLLGKIFARQLGHRHFLGMAVAFVRLVALIEPEWNPAHFVFHGDDLELGITLEYTAEDDIEQRVFDLACLLRADAEAMNAMAGLAVHTRPEAGEDMQMHRQIEILRGGPETLVVIRGKWQFFVRHLPDHCADNAGLLAALHLRDSMIDIEHGDQRDAV